MIQESLGRHAGSMLSCAVWRTFPPGDVHCQPDQNELDQLPSALVIAKGLGQIMFQRVSPKCLPWLPSLQYLTGFSLLGLCFSKEK